MLKVLLLVKVFSICVVERFCHFRQYKTHLSLFVMLISMGIVYSGEKWLKWLSVRGVCCKTMKEKQLLCVPEAYSGQFYYRTFLRRSETFWLQDYILAPDYATPYNVLILLQNPIQRNITVIHMRTYNVSILLQNRLQRNFYLI